MAILTTSDLGPAGRHRPWVVDVVTAWLGRRTPPRDAMAALPALRACPPAVRAAVAAAANAVVAAERRLWFGLGEHAGPAGMSPEHRARVLVLAHEVCSGDLDAAAAERLAAAGGGPRVSFAPLASLEARLAALGPGAAQLARRHSLPDWLAQRFLAEFGDDAAARLAALAAPAPRTLRANLLRVASRDELAEELAEQGVPTRPAAYAPHALHAIGDADLFATVAYQRGAFEQQDEASQLAALVVAPPRGGLVLDLCAGSGGKALALAAALQNRGEVLATDVHGGRLQALRQRAARAGAHNVRTMPVGEGAWPAAVAEFAVRADRILIDAPCSGTGSWRRRPEARWLLQPADLDALLRTQDELLDRAVRALRPGARIVYATCSSFAAENEQRIAGLCARCPDVEVVRIREILGGSVASPITDPSGTFLSLRPERHGCDGFFAAVLRRPRERRKGAGVPRA